MNTKWDKMRFFSSIATGTQKRTDRRRNHTFQTLEKRELLDGTGTIFADPSSDDTLFQSEDFLRTLTSDIPTASSSLSAVTQTSGDNALHRPTHHELPADQFVLSKSSNTGGSYPSLIDPFFENATQQGPEAAMAAGASTVSITLQVNGGASIGDTGETFVVDSSVIVSGNTRPNTLIRFDTDADGKFDDALTASDATGNFVESLNVGEGRHQISARVSDNGAYASAAVNVVVDPFYNGNPSVYGWLENDSGSSSRDGFTSDASLVGFGASSVPVDSLKVGVDSTDTASFVDVTNLWIGGVFRIDTSILEAAAGGLLQQGEHTAYIVAATTAGEVLATTEIDFTYDTVAPVSPTAPFLSVFSNSDSGAFNDDNITFSRDHVIRVGTEAAAVVRLYRDGQLAAEQPANSQGPGIVFSNFDVDRLPDGLHTFRASTEDLAGNIGDLSPAFTLTVDNIGPATPSFGLSVGSDTGVVGDSTTRLASVDLEGNTTPSVSIDLIDTLSEKIVDSTTADSSGVFLFQGVELSAGENLFRVDAIDIAGNATSATVVLTRDDTTAPVIFSDPDVEQAVRRTLNLENETITRARLQPLTSLLLDTDKVSDLGGLEYAVNLRSLRLLPTEYTQPSTLSSLTPILGLSQLEELALVGASLSSNELAKLAVLPTLRSLDLRYAGLTDVGFVPGLSSLERIRLWGNEGADLSALAGKAIVTDLLPKDLDKARDAASIAAALHFLPLELYEHVLNSVEMEIYAGALKGTQATIDTGRANPVDASRYLIELLELSGVEARFVKGRVVVREDILAEWLGTRFDVSAVNLLSRIGLSPAVVGSEFVPSDSDPSVGTLENLIEFDHTWVEAFLNVPGTGQQWVEFDPSWKFKDRQGGAFGILGAVPFDESDYLSEVREESAAEYYLQRVDEFVREDKPGVSVADLFYDGPIIQAQVEALPSQLPYDVESVISRTDSLTPEDRHRVSLEVSTGNATHISYSAAIADVALSKINLVWDENGSGQHSLQLWIDDQVVGSTPYASVTDPNNTGLNVRVQHWNPGDNEVDQSYEDVIPLGQIRALGVDAKQHSPSHLHRLQAEVNAAAIDSINGVNTLDSDDIANFLSYTVGTYIADGAQQVARLNSVVSSINYTITVASGWAFGQEDFESVDDLPNQFVPSEATIDFPNLQFIGYPEDDVPERLDDLRNLLGYTWSSLEGLTWEKVTNIKGMSTIKSLQLAAERGIPVFTIDASNRGTFVPQLTLGTSDIADINQRLDDGATVTVPRDRTPLDQWDGVGYIARGNGRTGYFISGGLSGGYATGSPAPPPSVVWANSINRSHFGDPVDIANGNVIRDELDIELPGIGLPLRLVRHYDSQSEVDNGFGPGWSHSYSDFLATGEEEGELIWCDGSGRCGSFMPDGQDGYTSPDGYFGELVAVDNGYEYREKNGLTRTFDAQGRLTRIEDRNENSQVLSYDGDGKLIRVADAIDSSRGLDFVRGSSGITAITDFTGRSWNYGYDGDGRLESAARPTDGVTPSSVTQYEYYSDTAREGLIKTITEPDGGQVSYAYYPDRRAFQVTDQEGHTQTLYYNLYRQQTTAYDGRDVPTLHEFNLDGNLVSLQQADLTVERHEWVDQLRVSSIDELGNTVTRTYDDKGNMLTETDRAGETTTYTYDPVFNQVTSITRPDGVVTTRGYDANGNLLSITDVIGGIRSFTYDSRGQMLTQTTPRGAVTPVIGDFTTTYTYDSAGLLLTASNDLPSQIVNTYSPRGDLLTRTDERGNTTSFTYDAVGRQLTEIDADGGITTFVYDAAGNRISETDPLGRTTTFAYNLFQKPLQTRFADGSISITSYDRNQNPIGQTDAEGYHKSRIYDDRGRVVMEYEPDGSSRLQLFNAAGSVRRVRDELRNWTSFSYDAEQRLVSERDALGGTTTYEYDLVGNRIAMTDARGARTNYFYDELDRIIRIDAPERQVSTIDYDANSNVVNRTSYELSGLARLPEDLSTLPPERVRETNFTYDVLDRRISTIDALGGIASVQHDAVGNVVSSTDEQGRVTTFAYDALNRRITTTDALDGVSTVGYDAIGNVVSTTDANGRQWTYSYDDRNRQVSAVDPLGGESTLLFDAVGSPLLAVDELGRGTEWQYDTRRRVVASRDAKGFESSFKYDAAGNEILIIDSLGHETAMSYDRLNRIARMLDGGIAETTYAYDAVGNITRITDPNGNNSTFTYDLAGREVESRDSIGGVTRTRYDSFGNITSTRDEERRWTFYTYDALDRVDAMVDPNGNVFRYSYDSVGNLLAAPNALGLTEQFTYDALNRELAAIDATGATTASTYDAVGNLLTVTDALGRVTTYAYDNLDRLVTTTDALGQVFSNTYDAASNLRTETDPLGDTTTYAYDALDRVVTSTDPLGAQTNSYYDGTGNPIAVVDALGRLTSSTYDSLDRIIASSDALGNVTTFVYDTNGNLLSTTDAENRRAEYIYDNLGRRVKVIEPLGQTTTFFYDGVGNLTSEIDPVGATTTYAYNVLDQQIATTDPLGATTRRTYNIAGDLTSLLDASNNLTTYVYDAIGRTVREIDPLGASRTFTYDAVGNLVAATDRNGRNRTMLYDDLDRLETERWFDGLTVLNEATFAYDAVGRTLSASDNYSNYAYGYDGAGRLLTVTNAGTPGVPTVAITHVRDAVGNVTSTTERINGSVERVQSYEYDNADRLVTLRQQNTGAADKRVEFSYDGIGAFTNVDRYGDDLGGQLVIGSDHTYDDSGRLILLNHQKNNGSYVNSYVFNYDDASRITLFVSADGPVNYDYDSRGQLLYADAQSQADEGFAYDDTGNRTGDGYAIGAANRQTSDGIFDYAHDAEGNLIRRTEIATGRVRELEYDHDNRVVRIVDRDVAAGPSTQVVEYTYDVNGRRIARSLDSNGVGPGGLETESYVYDGSEVALRFDGAGDLTDRYLHGPLVDQVLAQDDVLTGATEWLLNDHQQTVRDITDETGELLNHLEYSSFGGVTAETDAAVDSLFGYTGRERDTATGLQYNRARWYDPSTGRFLSEDPIGFDGGDENLYRYVANSPANFRDPTGNALKRNLEISYYHALNSFNQADSARISSSIQNQSFSPIGGQSFPSAGSQSFPSSSSPASFSSIAGNINSSLSGTGASTLSINTPSYTDFSSYGPTSSIRQSTSPFGSQSFSSVGGQSFPSSPISSSSSRSDSYSPTNLPPLSQPLALAFGGSIIVDPGPTSSSPRATISVPSVAGSNRQVLSAYGSQSLRSSLSSSPRYTETSEYHFAQSQLEAANRRIAVLGITATSLGVGIFATVGVAASPSIIASSAGLGRTALSAVGSISRTGVGVASRNSSNAQSVAQYSRLKEFYRQSEQYGQAGVRQLQNGKYRFYGEVTPANRPGPMAGRRVVREWDPSTGNSRTWNETVDHTGAVRQVRPQTEGPKTHYRFDAEGNFVGKF